MKELINCFTTAVTVLTVILLLPQLIYLLLGFFFRPKKDSEPEELRRYAVMICARNEENVIGQLIESLRKQNYPSELYDIYVLADNCTDRTAETASLAGARVFTRISDTHGKGYALNYLLKQIRRTGKYDAYIVFDADNIVDPDFISQMNRYWCSNDCDAVTCYRNTKNFSENWLSFASGIWYIKESRFANMVRERLGSNAMISGTGFLVSERLIAKLGGWPFTLLTEDIEFNVNCSINSIRIGYCHDAITYDEQAVSIADSFNQRLRWSKGFLQLNRNYLLKLIRSLFNVSSIQSLLTRFDQLGLMTLILLFYLQAVSFLANLSLQSLLSSLAGFWLSSALFCMAIFISEKKRIDISLKQGLFYSLLFPLYMIMYIPVNLACLFYKGAWKPISHHPLDK